MWLYLILSWLMINEILLFKLEVLLELCRKNQVCRIVILKRIHIFFFIFNSSLKIVGLEVLILWVIIYRILLWINFLIWLFWRQLHFRSLIFSLALASICCWWNLCSKLQIRFLSSNRNFYLFHSFRLFLFLFLFFPLILHVLISWNRIIHFCLFGFFKRSWFS